ncbi:MAG TPA: response regulator [Burkholderiales bacterium]|nr:response regulator [Burkholderiales bacterium]
MATTTVYVVSGYAAIRDSLSELAAAAGLRSEAHASLETWLEAVRPSQPGCLVLDASASDFSGAERLEQFASICAVRPVLLLIDRGDVPVAVRAMREGAVDVLEKPYRDANLLEHIQRADTAAAQASEAKR